LTRSVSGARFDARAAGAFTNFVMVAKRDQE
jgi:hypothetical protein